MWDKNVNFWQERRAINRRRALLYFFGVGIPIGLALALGAGWAPWPLRWAFIGAEVAIVVALLVLARRAGIGP